MKRRIITVSIILLFIAIHFALKKKARNHNTETFKTELIGIVSDVKYDAKTIPTVTINNKQLYLSNFGIRKRHQIEVGDSLHKNSNSKMVRHFKKYAGGFYLKESFEMKF